MDEINIITVILGKYATFTEAAELRQAIADLIRADKRFMLAEIEIGHAE